MRMHPVLGGILERIVPPTGLTLPDGRTIAPGTTVGVNPWVSSRTKEIYGSDTETFRPERWLRNEGEGEDEVASVVRLEKMKDADFTVGGGKRQCVGKNMATVDLHKVTSTLFTRCDVSSHLGDEMSPGIMTRRIRIICGRRNS